jgi:hypothetical protein
MSARTAAYYNTVINGLLPKPGVVTVIGAALVAKSGDDLASPSVEEGQRFA